MPNAVRNVWAGNSGVTRQYRVDGLTDLTAVTGVAPKVRLRDEDAWTTLTGSVVDAVARTIQVNYGTWLANLTVGQDYQLVIDLVTAGGTETWPSSPKVLPVVD